MSRFPNSGEIMGFAEKLRSFFKRTILDDSVFEELADLLVEGDLGAAFAYEVVDILKAQCKKDHITNPNDARRLLKSILETFVVGKRFSLDPSSLNIVLLLGVNGVGKTTSCAKLAYWAKQQKSIGDRIILAAGDTFRAAAVDQLKIHGQRLGLRVVSQPQGSDSAAVLWDSIEAAQAENARLVVADTAGRMHTRQDLLKELEKMDRIVAQKATGASYSRVLVLDATTGQNGLRQAEMFSSVVKVDGVILTKYDSTAKGGMVLSLARQFNLPTIFLGTGEQYEQLVPFEPAAFLADFTGI
jgi:fused signal recognition particle receptor